VSVKSLTTSSRRSVLPVMLSRLVATASRMSRQCASRRPARGPVAIEAHVEDRDLATLSSSRRIVSATRLSDGRCDGPSLTRLRRLVRALRRESSFGRCTCPPSDAGSGRSSASPWACRLACAGLAAAASAGLSPELLWADESPVSTGISRGPTARALRSPVV